MSHPPDHADEPQFFRLWLPHIQMFIEHTDHIACSMTLTNSKAEAGVFADPPKSLIDSLSELFSEVEKQPAEFSEWVAQGRDGT